MTQHPERRPQRARHTEPLNERPDTHHDTPTGDPITRIALWRLDSSDDDHPDGDPSTAFASRLAKRLVLVYTSLGDTIVDLDNDPDLLAAATTTGRAHLAITATADIAVLDELHPTGQPIGLVTMQWPRTAQPDAAPSAAAIADLFLACSLMTGGTATLIVVVRPAATANTDAFTGYERDLHAAADATGFAHPQRIVAVSAPAGGDAFVYYATHAEAVDTAANESTPSVTLLVFTPTHAGTRVHCDTPAVGTIP
jgi:hypothetical protein